jgi:hypothetical protein
LTFIALPAGLTSLGDVAFAGCSSLTSIELPASFDDSTLYQLRYAGVPPSTILRFALASAIENNGHVE